MIFDENVKKEIICNSNIAAIIAKPSDILFFRFFSPLYRLQRHMPFFTPKFQIISVEVSLACFFS